MRIARQIIVPFGLGAAILVAALPARAANPCIGDAKQQFTEQKAQCKEDYQAAKDACLNRDHACMEGCRAGREECVLASGLDESLTACRDALRDAKATCRATHVEGTPELDQCIDQAQVTGFLCRRAARTAAKPALKACRVGFRACAQACPPPVDPAEVVDKVQCKLDAKGVYLACKAAAREAFQAQKDLCLNRDHACVEVCRADRDTCREPVENQLDADIAACNATRDAGVGNCVLLYPEGPDRDACITAAQVDAFQCRDAARETAKPGFQRCRDAFQTCALACPPAS
jgi:hypothetical protein